MVYHKAISEQVSKTHSGPENANKCHERTFITNRRLFSIMDTNNQYVVPSSSVSLTHCERARIVCASDGNDKRRKVRML